MINVALSSCKPTSEIERSDNAESQVMKIFRLWLLAFDHAESGNVSDEEHELRLGARDAAEDALRAAQATSPRDLAIKTLIGIFNMEAFMRVSEPPIFDSPSADPWAKMIVADIFASWPDLRVMLAGLGRGAAPETPSAEGDIEGLFNLWIEAQRRGLALCEGVANLPFNSLPPLNCFDEAYGVIDRIAALPAVTISDLAIKSYLAIYNEIGAPRDNLFDIDFTESATTKTLPQQSLFADAKRLSPLVAAAVSQASAAR